MKNAKLVLLLGFTALTAFGASAKKAIKPDPNAAAMPFSPGIQAGQTLYVAGQTGRDAKLGKIPDNFEDEVKQTLENVGTILKAAGYSFEDAVAVQVYLTDMDLFPRMNAVYTTYFPEPRPARTTVGVSRLVGTSKIEITVTAWKK